MNNKIHKNYIYFAWILGIIMAVICIAIKDFGTLFFLGAIIIAFTIIGVFNIEKEIKTKKLTEENGIRIYAKYVKCKIANLRYRKNLYYYPEEVIPDALGFNKFIITCEGENPITGKKTFFQSELIPFNPAKIIEENFITMLPIIIDRENPKIYKVVLDELYELAKKR